MFCFKCGKELPEGSKFCPKCGEAQSYDACKEIENKCLPEKSSDEVIVASEETQQAIKSKMDFAKYINKISKKVVIFITIVVLVVLILVVLLNSFLSRNKNTYAYLSNGVYGLITDIDKEQVIEIDTNETYEESSLWTDLWSVFVDDSENKNANEDLLIFSPSGKYIYYYKDYDDDSETGTLCRVLYKKLGEDSVKNENYIETIAQDVQLGVHLKQDDSAIFLNGEDVLFYYDGVEMNLLHQNVDSYYLDEQGRLIYIVDEEDNYTLYGIVSEDINHSVKLAENVDCLENIEDFDNILYTKTGEYSNQDLYVVGFNRAEEKIGSNISYLSQSGEKTYYLADNGEFLNLYDYVEDDCKESDEKEKKPMKSNFETSEYQYERIQDENVSEDDFDELYTSCSKKLTWLAGGKYSMEEAVDVNWSVNSEEIQTAAKNFVEKYGDLEDENGYILVTDEVKNALQDIQQYSDTPEKEWEWLWFCYNKCELKNVDEAAYQSAFDAWEVVYNRMELRKSLQEEKNAYRVRSLYCFDKNNITVIQDRVLAAKAHDGGIVFNTVDEFNKKVNITSLSSVEEARAMFDVDNEAEMQILLMHDGSLCKLSADANKFMLENEFNYNMYFTKDNVAYLTLGGVLYYSPIEGAQITKFKIIDEYVENVSVEDATLYYMVNESDDEYHDLYLCNTGKSECIAENILSSDSRLYADGAILAHTNHVEDDGYELCLFKNNGQVEEIADGVIQSIRIDEDTLMYISRGDLYYYDGEKKKYIRGGVDRLWCKESLEAVCTFQ